MNTSNGEVPPGLTLYQFRGTTGIGEPLVGELFLENDQRAVEYCIENGCTSATHVLTGRLVFGPFIDPD